VIVSPGNSKLGRLPNVSLIPGKDCTNCSKCATSCYALKAFRAYPSVNKSWTDNSETLRNNPAEYFAEVRAYLSRHTPVLFRIHVAGDFITQEHLDQWLEIAKEFPSTRFLAFTKSFAFLPLHSALPENMSLVVSMWPGMKAPARKGYAIAYAGDAADYQGSHNKRAAAAVDCPGNCDTCGICWSLAKKGQDVIFPFH